MTLKVWLTALLAILASQPADAQSRQTPAQQQADQITASVQPYADAGQISGVLLVTEDGKTLVEKAYGKANGDLAINNTPSTIFGVASVTKLMTTTLRQVLVDQGLLSDADTISKFLPGFPNGDRITIDMLARHQSGIPHRVTTFAEEAKPATSEEMAARVARAGLLFEPGTQRSYSSAGYSLLARVMEIATGKSYAELLRAYVFEPAEMTNSFTFESRKPNSNWATDFLLSPDGVTKAPTKDYSYLIGAGSVFSTARDLLKFGEAVLRGTYGPTLKGRLAPNGVLIGNGVTNGHRAFLKIDEKTRIGIILVSNLHSGANDSVLKNVELIMAGKDPEPPNIPKPSFTSRRPASELAQYAGAYLPADNPSGLRLDLRVEDGMLKLSDWTWYPTTPRCFFEYESYGEICFVEDPDGRVRARWKAPGFAGEWLKSQ